MNPDDQPHWLLSAEHGVLGEARARALLLERFWVLDRSIDVRGADLLIQRRYLLDRKAQILGRIQAKFVQDGRTSMRIPRRDIVDEDGTAQDYFLLIFTGFGKESRSFLISANELVHNFQCSGVDGSDSYYVPARKVFESDRFEIMDVGLSLNRVEDALRRADFEDVLRNRRFILRSQYPDIKIDPAHIHEDYELPLHTWYGDLREEFFKTKQRMKDAIVDMTDAIEQLRGFIECTDPVEAWYRIEEFIHWHRTTRNKIQFDWDLVSDEFIEEAIKRRRTLEKLRGLQVEMAYLELPSKLQEFVIDDLAPYLPLGDHQCYVVTICMDRPVLSIRSIVSEVKDVDRSAEPIEWRGEIKELENESIQITYPTNLFHQSETEKLAHLNLAAKKVLLRGRGWHLSRDFMDWIDETVLKLYEPRSS
jgi:hypothetical protein